MNNTALGHMTEVFHDRFTDADAALTFGGKHPLSVVLRAQQRLAFIRSAPLFMTHEHDEDKA